MFGTSIFDLWLCLRVFCLNYFLCGVELYWKFRLLFWIYVWKLWKFYMEVIAGMVINISDLYEWRTIRHRISTERKKIYLLVELTEVCNACSCIPGNSWYSYFKRLKLNILYFSSWYSVFIYRWFERRAEEEKIDFWIYV